MRDALKAGKLVKPSACEECHAEEGPVVLYAHHDDYSKPLNVRWLCGTCHQKWHYANTRT